MNKAFLVVVTFFITHAVFSQNVWDLRRTVEYAIANNISVKQANISSLQAVLDFNQNRFGFYPTASAFNDWGLRFGRTQSNTTGVFENANSIFSSFGFNTSVNIFNFFAQRNLTQASRYQAASVEASEEKAKNDIAIRVANAYLLALQAKEQVHLSELKIKLTTEQLNVTRKRIEAGSLPELNAAEIEAQLARDTSDLVSAVSNRELQLLQLKAILNLDAAVPFDIDTPDVEKLPLQPLADLQPEVVYQLALINLPQQRISDLNIKAAEKQRDAYRGNMYPSIRASGSLSSNFSGSFQIADIGSLVGEEKTGFYARDGTNIIPVYTPTYGSVKKGVPLTDVFSSFGRQIRSNFGQSVGLSLSVPLLNGYQAKTRWEKSKLNIRNYQLQKEQDTQNLKQEVYTAYNNAIAALQKQKASAKAVETALRSYDLSKKRYDVNLLSSFELITNQNNLFNAQIDLLLARYDYVFKMKLLEFYKGQGFRM